MNIGVIDSGMGGFQILNILKNKKPCNNYLLIADTGFFPYGEKTYEDLKKRVIFLVNELVKNDCKVIYLACNTISALYFEDVKEIFGNIVLKDMITPLVHYINEQNYISICVIGSELLVKSKVYSKLIKCSNVLEINQSIFIDHIENQDDIKVDIIELMTKINNKFDCLVLACTHFISVQDKLSMLFNGDVISQKDVNII